MVVLEASVSHRRREGGGARAGAASSFSLSVEGGEEEGRGKWVLRNDLKVVVLPDSALATVEEDEEEL